MLSLEQLKSKKNKIKEKAKQLGKSEQEKVQNSLNKIEELESNDLINATDQFNTAMEQFNDSFDNLKSSLTSKISMKRVGFKNRRYKPILPTFSNPLDALNNITGLINQLSTIQGLADLCGLGDDLNVQKQIQDKFDQLNELQDNLPDINDAIEQEKQLVEDELDDLISEINDEYEAIINTPNEIIDDINDTIDDTINDIDDTIDDLTDPILDPNDDNPDDDIDEQDSNNE